MKRWCVVTPEFPYTEIIDPEIGGPTYDVCDVVEIEAENRHDAIVFGVKVMLADHGLYSYCRDQRDSGLCPFEGVTAHVAEDR